MTVWRQLFSPRALLSGFVSSLTVLWLLLEPVLVFREAPRSWYGVIGLMFASLVCTVALNWPRSVIKRRFSHNDLTIRVVKGDVLTASGNIVIGVCDTFDTEIGAIIRDTSLQGQFQSTVFQGGTAQLDKQLSEALADQTRFAIHDPDKQTGKQLRFPVGTTAVIHQTKRYFLLVYTKMGNDLACVPTPAEHILIALFKLWDVVRRAGQHESVAIPIIASDLARSGLSRMTLLRMIILTFYTAHATKPITSQLDIYVHPKDVEHVDFGAVRMFLRTL